MRHIIRLILLSLLAFSIAAPAQAQARASDLKRVEDYLTSLNTIVADFTQVAPDGSLATGKFYLKRPGKMRWQYDPPTPILMVANGSVMTFYDFELEQVNNIPIDDTLVGLLAQEKIILHDPKILTIERFEESNGVVRITMKQTEHKSDGAITLEFTDKPLQIRNMIIVDKQGQTTSVSLNNARYGEKLDNDLFVFRDPRKKSGSRNR